MTAPRKDAAPLRSHALRPVHALRVMGRIVRRQTKDPGAAPGTLVHTGPQRVEQTGITVMEYGPDRLREWVAEDPGDIRSLREARGVSWINVEGLHETDLIQSVGDDFGIHPLVLEDVVHVGQRPKVEEYEDYLYVVLTMLDWDPGQRQVTEEQLSVVVGATYVLTFQERAGDVLDPVRERIRGSSPQIRSRGADYLAYALIDAVVDRYFTVAERIGELCDELELAVMDDGGPEVRASLHHLKRELLLVRRAVSPVRELANALMRTESGLVEAETRVFLRDVHDHAIRLVESTDILRDMVSGLMDLHLSALGQRTNEVMKVLTVMATIFIPLTFIAGIYGMNFENMPELAWPWAYPVLLGVMLVMGGLMVVYFKRKDWI